MGSSIRAAFAVSAVLAVLFLTKDTCAWDPIRDCEDRTKFDLQSYKISIRNDYCYYVFKTRISAQYGYNYQTAHLQCRASGTDLVSIHGQEENEYVRSLLEDIGKFDAFWIGLNEMGLEGYEWTDRTPVDYVNWLPGQPDDKYGSEMCAVMEKNGTGGWRDENCATMYYYGHVCKRVQVPQSTTRGPPTTQPWAGYCPEGAYEIGNKCYKVFGQRPEDRVTWDQAADACRNMATGKRTLLASITSRTEINALVMVMNDVPFSAWIGLHRNRNQQWEWVENSRYITTYTNWGTLRPRHAYYKTNCTRVYESTHQEKGKWTDDKCSERFGYICQYIKDPNNPIGTPPTGAPGCRAGYSMYSGACYRAYTDPMTFFDAEDTCKRDGATLASIHGSAENTYIYSFMGVGTAYYFIGLSDFSIRYTYHWSDQTTLDYSYWGSYQPRQTGGGGCVASRARRWYDTRCRDAKPFICKYWFGSPPPTVQPRPGRCPAQDDDKWRHFHTDCFYIEGTRLVTNYATAVTTCRNLPSTYGNVSATLASVRSSNETAFLLTQFGLMGMRRAVWIGLRRTSDDRFEWLDGSPFFYTNWGKGEPKNDTSAACAVMYYTGQWYTSSCLSNVYRPGVLCRGDRELLPIPSTVSRPAPTQSKTTSRGRTTFPPFFTFPPTGPRTTFPWIWPSTREPTVSYIGPRPGTLSGGAIAGIVIGVMAGVAVIVVGVLFFLQWRQKNIAREKLATPFRNTDFGNPNYDFPGGTPGPNAGTVPTATPSSTA